MTADPNAGTAFAILGSLLEATIRVAVLALVVALALTALRIRTAGRLHVWTIVLCAALAMPLLMTTTPAWPGLTRSIVSPEDASTDLPSTSIW